MPATDPSKDRGGRAGEDVRAAADTRRLPEEVTDWFVREPVGERVSPIVPAPGGAGPVDMPDLRVVTDGRYAEFEFVGRGGMGSVYRALDRETNRRVALKIVRTEGERIADPLSATAPPTGTADHALFLRTAVKFLQEAWVTAGLEHPGVIPVYEVARTKSGVPFYTMRYLAGRRTLDKAIEESGGLDDRLALLDAFLTVCGAVEYAHTRGVVHRDLKPSNIGLGAFGEVVVFDWGLARLLGRPDSEADRWRARIRDLRRGRDPHEPQGVFGTPGYLSPEAVFGGPEETDERSDVYALGVILYRILTKRLPFDFAEFGELVRRLAEGDPPAAAERDPGVPGALSAVCAGALARNPAARTPSVRALSDGVRAHLRESAGEAEVGRLMREARKAWDGAEDLSGLDLLGRVEQVLARTARVLELRPGRPDALLLAECARAGRIRAVETLTGPGRREG